MFSLLSVVICTIDVMKCVSHCAVYVKQCAQIIYDYEITFDTDQLKSTGDVKLDPLAEDKANQSVLKSTIV